MSSVSSTGEEDEDEESDAFAFDWSEAEEALLQTALDEVFAL